MLIATIEKYYSKALDNFKNYLENRKGNSFTLDDFVVKPYCIERVLDHKDVSTPCLKVYLEIEIDNEEKKKWDKGTYCIFIDLEDNTIFREEMGMEL